MENSLTILSESLDKKLEILQKVQEYNKRQEKAFSEETIDLDDFDAAIEEKGKLIDEINRLDAGFETLYARLADELKNNRERYAAQIRELQQKVTAVTDLSVTVQAQEARNKQLVEQYFAKRRAGIKEGRTSSKAAYNYYKNNYRNSIRPETCSICFWYAYLLGWICFHCLLLLAISEKILQYNFQVCKLSHYSARNEYILYRSKKCFLGFRNCIVSFR